MASALTIFICVAAVGLVYGDQVFNSQNQYCCRGLVYSFGMGYSACCNNNAYNPGTQMCCNGAVQNLYENGNVNRKMVCCDQRAVFPIANKVCCSGQLVDPPTQIGALYGCCGFNSFNTNTQMCCNGVVSAKTGPATACCGNQPYDSTTQACCNGRISPLPPATTLTTYKCCGQIAYNKLVQVCCSGDTTFPTSGAPTLLPILDADRTACANCEYSCCGNKVFRTQEQLCCNNVVIPIPAANVNSALSNSAFFKNSGAYCCDGADGKTPVLDPATQMCCHSGVKTKTIGAGKCCADAEYDSTFQSCCGNTIIPLTSPTNPIDCCNGQPYNTLLRICCGNGLVDRSSGTDGCCTPNIDSSLASGNNPFGALLFGGGVPASPFAGVNSPFGALGGLGGLGSLFGGGTPVAVQPVTPNNALLSTFLQILQFFG